MNNRLKSSLLIGAGLSVSWMIIVLVGGAYDPRSIEGISDFLANTLFVFVVLSGLTFIAKIIWYYIRRDRFYEYQQTNNDLRIIQSQVNVEPTKNIKQEDSDPVVVENETLKPGFNYQIPIVCPNCHAKNFVGMRRSIFYFTTTGLLSIIVAGLIMSIMTVNTDREFGLMLLGYGVFMSLILVFNCSTRFKKSRCNICGGIIKAEYKKKDIKDYEWVATFIPTAASDAYSAEPAKNITATSRVEFHITRALKILVGLLIVALGVNMPDIIGIKGDLPEIAGYMLMALGSYMLFDGLSSVFKNNKNG